MRILLVTMGLPLNLNDVTGGVQAAVINLLSGFYNKNHSLKILSYSNFVKEEINCQLTERINIVYTPYRLTGINKLDFLLRSGSRLRKHKELFKPDIIHFQLGGFFLIAGLGFLNHRATILTIHGIYKQEAKYYKSLAIKLEYFFADIFTKILMPCNIIHISKYSAYLFRKFSHSMPAIIYNSTNKAFYNIPLKKKFERKIIYVGVINERKNLILLLRVLKVLCSMRRYFYLEVIGGYDNSPYMIEIEKYVNDNKLEPFIKFYGWLNQPTLIEKISDSDIFILPSRQETLPVSVSEALAAGKVVIASKVGGVPEMIEDNHSGFLFDDNSSEQLLEILMNLYNNPNLVSSTCTNARNSSIQKYFPDNIADKIIDYYNLILTDSKFI